MAELAARFTNPDTVAKEGRAGGVALADGAEVLAHGRAARNRGPRDPRHGPAHLGRCPGANVRSGGRTRRGPGDLLIETSSIDRRGIHVMLAAEDAPV